MKLKSDIMQLTELLQNKEKYISSVHQEFKNKEDQLIGKINELQNKLDNTMINTKDTEDRCEKLEKEIMEIVKFIFNKKVYPTS
jgi:peptidoglycan hydrolase CwlO-like protein